MNNNKGKGMTEQTKNMSTQEKIDFYVTAAHLAERFVESADATELDAPDYFSTPLHSHTEALDWFEAEHANLLAAQCVAADRGRHEDVWSLAQSLTAYHHRRGGLRALLAVWTMGLTAAEYLSDSADSALITAHRLLGDTYAAVGWHDKAIDHLHDALTLAERHDDVAEQASTHFILAIAHERNEDNAEALEHALQALIHYRNAGNTLWEAATLNMVGWHNAQLGDYDEARKHCQASLELHRKHNDRAGEARALGSLAYIHHNSDDYDQAIVHYRQALELFHELGHTLGVAGTLEELGDTHAAAEQPAQASAAWEEALELYRKQGRHRAIADITKKLDELNYDE